MRVEGPGPQIAAHRSAHAASNFLNSLFSDKQRLAPEETLWEVVSGC